MAWREERAVIDVLFLQVSRRKCVVFTAIHAEKWPL